MIIPYMVITCRKFANIPCFLGNEENIILNFTVVQEKTPPPSFAEDCGMDVVHGWIVRSSVWLRQQK